MKFKLDENLGKSIHSIFQNYGHDVETVLSENLSGSADDNLFAICCRESRCLVTLDLDFSNLLRFQPKLCAGIIVLRIPSHFSTNLFKAIVCQLLKTLDVVELKGNIWIVEPGRIRIHQMEDDD